MRIGFVLFPGVTQLDFTGPLQALCRIPDAEIIIAAKTMEPVESDSTLKLCPTHDFATCPPLDVICVPGGFGVAPAIEDGSVIDFIKAQAAGAKYITSVCTGAFLLGAAGLLQGRKATTHWGYTGLLPLVGATYEKARVVRDRNVFTGGGVTAGIDFAFTLIAEICGDGIAKAIQLAIEYDPSPPFKSGHPDHAGEDTLKRIRPIYDRSRDTMRKALETFS